MLNCSNSARKWWNLTHDEAVESSPIINSSLRWQKNFHLTSMLLRKTFQSEHKEFHTTREVKDLTETGKDRWDNTNRSRLNPANNLSTITMHSTMDHLRTVPEKLETQWEPSEVNVWEHWRLAHSLRSRTSIGNPLRSNNSLESKTQTLVVVNANSSRLEQVDILPNHLMEVLPRLLHNVGKRITMRRRIISKCPVRVIIWTICHQKHLLEERNKLLRNTFRKNRHSKNVELVSALLIQKV